MGWVSFAGMLFAWCQILFFNSAQAKNFYFGLICLQSVFFQLSSGLFIWSLANSRQADLFGEDLFGENWLSLCYAHHWYSVFSWWWTHSDISHKWLMIFITLTETQIFNFPLKWIYNPRGLHTFTTHKYTILDHYLEPEIFFSFV